VREELGRSRRSLEDGEHQYFQKMLGQSEAWRAYPEFKGRCVFLDIETDGGQSGSSITTIGLWDGREFRCLLKDQDAGNFADIISHYSMIVTFFGTGFDLPVLQRAFRNLRLDQIHLDLCPMLRKLGYKGGLKRIEKEFGIQRSPETEGLTGLDAVRLWRRYRALGDERSLDRLIAYNREDCVNLEALADRAYEKLKQLTYLPAASLA
jgi:uncharacterized protein